MIDTNVVEEAEKLVRNKNPKDAFKEKSGAVTLRVVAEAEDEPASLVIEIRRLRSIGETKAAQRISGQLVTLMDKTLADAARRYEGVRGSIEVDDLLQIGRLQVLKVIDSYDGRGSFASRVYVMAGRAMGDHVQTQNADVTVAYDAQRGRSRAKGAAVVVVNPTQGPASVFEAPTSTTPEDEYSAQEQAARLREALAKLEPGERELLRKVYGVGRQQQSIRSIAHDTGVSRSKLDETIARATAHLRKLLAE